MPKISEEKKHIRREHILEVAFVLFAEKGYSATSIREIVEAADISKGGIYVYFKSKAEIFLAIVERFDGRRHGIIENIDITLSGEEIFSRYIKGRLEVFKCKENLKWSRIVSEFWSLPNKVPKLSDIVEERFKAYQTDIEFIIKLGIDKGAFRKDCRIKEAVYLIMSSINGVAFLSASMGRIVTDKQIEETINMYLMYLKG